MFRTSCVRHHKDHLHLQFSWYVFLAEITKKGYIRYLDIKFEVRKISTKA